MTNQDEKPDPVEAAIGATQHQVQMEQMTVTIASTGRPFMLAFPSDMTEPELLEVVGWMATALRGHVNATREKGAASRLIVPAGVRMT